MPQAKARLTWKTTSAAVRSEGALSRRYTFVFSSGELDRGNDFVKQAVIDVTHFKENPVVLWAHSYSTPPIARVPAIWFRDGKLHGSIEFPSPGISPLADQVEGLVREGFIQACSIGFSPVEWSHNERGGIDYTRIELYEVSLVPIGANRQALLEAERKGLKTDLLTRWFAPVRAKKPARSKSRSVSREELAAAVKVGLQAAIPVTAEVLELVTRTAIREVAIERLVDASGALDWDGLEIRMRRDPALSANVAKFLASVEQTSAPMAAAIASRFSR